MQLFPFFAPEDPSKPYDFCEKLCPFREAKKCDGPNYLSAGFDRFVELCMLRKDILRKKDSKWTNAYIAEKSQLSITTINRFFSGGIDDLKFSTASQIVNALSDGEPAKHPCPMESLTKVIKENGLEELLADFETKKDECRKLKNDLEQTQSQIEFLRQQIVAKDAQIVEKNKHLDERADFLRRKDRAIRWMAVSVGICVLIVFVVLSIAM